MTYVLLTLAFLLALLIALLAIPLSLCFTFRRNQEMYGYARFRWLFGAINFQTNLTSEIQLESLNGRNLGEKSKQRKTKRNMHGIIAMIKQSAFRQHIIKFIKDILRATHAQDLYLRLRIGLGDPADTGMLWAVIGPLSGMLKNIQTMQVEIEPEFIDAVMEIESHGQFNFIPIQFIALTIAFMLSPTTIRAWREMQKSN